MKCKARTEVYSRVCGYYRPVVQWNPGKTAEYAARRKYNVGNAFLDAKTTPSVPVESKVEGGQSA